MSDSRARCLVYAAYSFNGTGPAQSCASIVANFPDDLVAEVYLARTRIPLGPNVRVHQALPPVVRKLPWRLVADRADRAVERAFAHALRQHDPATSVAYIWPGAPVSLIRTARECGMPVVREMINSACATSGRILDAAYRGLGLPPTHTVTAQAIAGETEELLEFDYLFASNPEVEASLARLDIPAERILPTTFGWDSDRSADPSAAPRLAQGIRALFVGSIGVRKGIPDLLAAWQGADVDGELVLAGRVEPAIADLVDRHTASRRVRLAGFVDDLGPLYRSADVFVFPTLEEGGPQVTYEAAGCGLPVITTPMGAARLVDDGRTGIVVPPGDRQRLTDALHLLGTDASLRAEYGARAKDAAAAFDYRHVGLARGRMLADIALRRASAGGPPRPTRRDVR